MTPARRSDDLVVRVSGDETLVFDSRTDQVHCLSAELVAVWNALDASRTLEEVADIAGTTEGATSAAIVNLDELNLLETPAGFDRRKFLTRAGLVGAGAVSVTVLAPLAAAHASTASETLTVTLPGSKQVKIAGTGFPANTSYTLSFDPTASVASGGSTDGSGNFTKQKSASQFGLTSGTTYTVMASDGNAADTITSAPFTAP